MGVTVISTIGNVAATVAFLGALTFILRYSRTSWGRTQMGRHLMAFMAITGALLGVASYISWFGYFAGWAILRLFLYSLYAVVIWQRFLLLVKAQKARPSYTGPERRRNE